MVYMEISQNHWLISLLHRDHPKSHGIESNPTNLGKYKTSGVSDPALKLMDNT
jgi:hypothetical protein